MLAKADSSDANTEPSGRLGGLTDRCLNSHSLIKTNDTVRHTHSHKCTYIGRKDDVFPEMWVCGDRSKQAPIHLDVPIERERRVGSRTENPQNEVFVVQPFAVYARADTYMFRHPGRLVSKTRDCEAQPFQ